MGEKIVILVAEDDEADVFLLERALKIANIEASIHFVSDGQYAIEYLAGQGLYADRVKYPFPHFAILDIKMPRMDGFEALEWIRAQKQFERLPVMIISASDEDRDIRKANALGVSAYLVKPSDAQILARELKRFQTFWSPFMQNIPHATAPTAIQSQPAA